MHRSHVLLLGFVIACLLLPATQAGANGHRDGNDALDIRGAKVSLAQAVATAEQAEHGQASHAEFENHDGQPVYTVEVVSADAVHDVTVDALSGTVLKSEKDAVDADKRHEDEDD